MGSRHTYYHVLYVGMINIMMFVPYFLIKERFHGAVLGMLIALAIGTILSLVSMACYERFPGLGFPELCDLYLPRWLTVTINLYGALLTWLPAGAIVIYSYSETVRMFFYPEMNPFVNLLLMAGAAVWASSRSTRTVQFVHEMMIIIVSPLLIMFLMKAIFNPGMDWNAIRYVSGYVSKPPSFITIAAGSFLFSGFMSLIVFNRFHQQGFRFRFRWIVPVFATFFLAVTFFVPIGFHGTEAVEDYVYLWSMTADSMIMEYGFINRVLFVFLLIFTGVSLLFIMNTWHVAILLIRHSINRFALVEEAPVSKINLWIALAAAGLSFVYMRFINVDRNQMISEVWLITRFFNEIVFLLIMLYFVWKKRKEGSTS